MTLHAFTARIGARDPCVLDITRKTAGSDGLAFAPSWAILKPVLDERTRIDALSKGATNADKIGHAMTARDLRRQAREAEEALRAGPWSDYVTAYTSEMRFSYTSRSKRADWLRLLARERVVLVCYCLDSDFCHRTILARDILPKLGAVYAGEIGASGAQEALFT